jgi:hypothetical protein
MVIGLPPADGKSILKRGDARMKRPALELLVWA